MQNASKHQLTLDFEAGLSKCYASGRELIQALVHQQNKLQKAIAADMDLAPSQLTRKLAQSPNDSARFTLDDAETWMNVTQDYRLIEYYIDRYLATASISKIEQLEAEIIRLKQNKNVA